MPIARPATADHGRTAPSRTRPAGRQPARPRTGALDRRLASLTLARLAGIALVLIGIILASASAMGVARAEGLVAAGLRSAATWRDGAHVLGLFGLAFAVAGVLIASRWPAFLVRPALPARSGRR